jgi:hypothetical protein
MNLCGPSSTLVDLPDAGDRMCCYGAAMGGPGRCTCWTEVYDHPQTDPDPLAVQLLAAGIHPVTRRSPCHDCAYRPDSPERTGDERFQGDEEFLQGIVERGERFWCHQGIRMVVALRHPAGVEIPVPPGGYRPARVDAVPYRADGTPAEICGGWAARRRALGFEDDAA